MSDGSNYLDPNRPDAVRLSVSDARALGEAALGRIGYGGDDARIITDRTERTFAQRWAGEGRLPSWEAGSGETIVTIANGERLPRRAHALLAEHRRVIVFAMTADAGTPREAARRIGAAVAALGVERFDLMGEGPHPGICAMSCAGSRHLGLSIGSPP